MKILMVTSETVPFSKSGGLADVVGALSTSLAELGHSVTVFMPFYSFIPEDGFRKAVSFKIPMLGKNETAEVYEKDLNGVTYAALSHPYFKERNGIYGDTSFSPYPDNCPRFMAFSKAVALYIVARGLEFDIVHCHDWTTGFVPHYLKHFRAPAKTIYTIHNLEYQGEFPLFDAVYSSSLIPKAAVRNGHINMMALALNTSDKITTVSPSYTEEILTPQFGAGIEDLLKLREDDTTGILNGIDTEVWNPGKDRLIPNVYSLGKMEGKKECKEAIQKEFKLKEEPDTPLIALISRLASQKGFDELLMEGEECALERILRMKCQVALIGTGDSRYISKLGELMAKYDNLSIKILFSEELSHTLEAGADFFLMPSVYEPCGLNQMYSLVYGTIPVVHAVGGLKDTVKDISEKEGNGITFTNLTPDEIVSSTSRAIELYSNKDKLDRVISQAMGSDFSWLKSAKEYEKLYTELISKA